MEKRDLYDINRRLTGKTIYIGDAIPEGSYIHNQERIAYKEL